MHRDNNSADSTGGSPPSEAWLFAQKLLGKPIPDPRADEGRARAEREHLEWLAKISPEHATQLRKLQGAEAETRHQRELLEWLATFSPEHAVKLRGLLRKEFEAEQFNERCLRLIESERAPVVEWNEADHPRKPDGPGG